MRSMYRFSMVALAVGALALCMAGSAFAAQHEGMAKGYQLGGSVTTGIGQFSDGSADVSSLYIVSEAIVNFEGKAGPVTGKLRLEANATPASSSTSCAALPCKDSTADGRLNNLRNGVYWAVTDAFTLMIEGGSFGFVTPYGGMTVGHFTSINPGVGDWWANRYGTGANKQILRADFKLGGGSVGLGLLPNAQLGVTDDGEAMTFAPYWQGSFGNISANAYYMSSSNKSDESSTEISLGGTFTTSAFNATLHVVSGKLVNEDSYTGLGLGARFGGIAVHYISQKNGDADAVADIALGYTGAIASGASWFVGLGSRDDGGTETDQAIQFSVQGKF